MDDLHEETLGEHAHVDEMIVLPTEMVVWPAQMLYRLESRVQPYSTECRTTWELQHIVQRTTKAALNYHGTHSEPRPYNCY